MADKDWTTTENKADLKAAAAEHGYDVKDTSNDKPENK